MFQRWVDLPLGTDDKEMSINEENIYVQEVANSIDEGSYSIPQLVKDMEPYLTSDTDLPTTARGYNDYAYMIPILTFYSTLSAPTCISQDYSTAIKAR